MWCINSATAIEWSEVRPKACLHIVIEHALLQKCVKGCYKNLKYLGVFVEKCCKGLQAMAGGFV